MFQQASTQKKLEGIWVGVLEVSGIKLRIVLKIAQGADNALTAKMDVPDQGASDLPPKENLAGIDAALKEGGNKDYTLVLLPQLNHLFQTSKTGLITEYGEIEETISPVALKTMLDWILKHTTAPNSPKTTPPTVKD